MAIYHTLTNERRKQAFRERNFEIDPYYQGAQGLVGYWPLGMHGDGDNTEPDKSLFRNNGTKTNGPTRKFIHHPRWGAVPVLDFVTDDFVDVVDSDDTKYTGELTICVWAKIDTGSAFRHFAGKHTGNGTVDDPFDFRTTDDATPLMHIVRANTSRKHWDGPAVTLGARKHYCVAAPSLIENAPTFYVDAVATTGVAAGGTGTGAPTGSGANIRFGDRADSAVTMDGQMNDFRIFNRILPAAELTEHFLHPELLVRPRTRTFYSFPAAAASTATVRLVDHNRFDRLDASRSGQFERNPYSRFAQGLVGWWPTSHRGSWKSGTLRDKSGQGNDGTLTNMDPATDFVVNERAALDFDGSNDLVDVGDISLGSGPITISVWVKWNATPNNVLIGEDDAGAARYIVYVTSTDILWRAISETTQSAAHNGISTGQWYHFVVTRDSGNTIRWYQDGVALAGTGTSSANPNMSTLGARPDNAFNLNGQMDHVLAYTRAMSAVDVSQLYIETKPGGYGSVVSPSSSNLMLVQAAAAPPAPSGAPWFFRRNVISRGVAA